MYNSGSLWINGPFVEGCVWNWAHLKRVERTAF